jgi:hypothetical protein
MWRRRSGADLLDTEEMAVFFDRLDHLNEGQLLGMRAAWQSTDAAAHQEAWAAVRAVGLAQGLTGEIDRVRDKALAWASRGSNVVPYTFTDQITWLQIKMEAGEAIVDAALAIALGTRLDDDSHAVLIEPWRRTIEV